MEKPAIIALVLSLAVIALIAYTYYEGLRIRDSQVLSRYYMVRDTANQIIAYKARLECAPSGKFLGDCSNKLFNDCYSENGFRPLADGFFSGETSKIVNCIEKYAPTQEIKESCIEAAEKSYIFKAAIEKDNPTYTYILANQGWAGEIRQYTLGIVNVYPLVTFASEQLSQYDKNPEFYKWSEPEQKCHKLLAELWVRSFQQNATGNQN